MNKSIFTDENFNRLKYSSHLQGVDNLIKQEDLLIPQALRRLHLKMDMLSDWPAINTTMHS